MTAPDAFAAPVPTAAPTFSGLTPEQRYEIVSQQFPAWLLAEPIEFPPHHDTYGWMCRVAGCEGGLPSADTRLLCAVHAKEYIPLRDTVDLSDFVRTAAPSSALRLGWGLSRKPDCQICGPARESYAHGFCRRHSHSRWIALRRGLSEADWRRAQKPLPPVEGCVVERCVHDGGLYARVESEKFRACLSHYNQWRWWRKSTGREPDREAWTDFLGSVADESVTSTTIGRGTLTLKHLPPKLQCEIRFALHRHANTPRRTQWRPSALQKAIDILAAAAVLSLNDAILADLVKSQGPNSGERRILADLPIAARSLILTRDMAMEAGWFDPAVVGASPFRDSQNGLHRRKVWDLGEVSQRWLRDLLWNYLSDEALAPEGRKVSGATISQRIGGTVLLSRILHQNRSDHGEFPELLGVADAQALKDTWDLWFREQIPLPARVVSPSVRPAALKEYTRYLYMFSMRTVLLRSRERHRTPAQLDSFILSMPEYPPARSAPRPRPLRYDDFQRLVDANNIHALEGLDNDDIGFADIWLTQAFQGGRIGETINLRLGCIGLIGAAQPYLWRDITKVGIGDYGMPCYLPVYERLLRRREITLSRLRKRHFVDLAGLDDRERARFEAQWDREMPLFPGLMANPDLSIAVSSSWFREVWSGWFESLGLVGITTHQTRATLATSLLNNGAPPALVRQLLGHFSEEALAFYANYSNDIMARHLQQVWAASPGMDKPGTILLRPADLKTENPAAAAARIDLAVVPVEHGLCRYGPVVGGAQCPWEKNCSDGPKGTCEHFVLTGADLAYWERKRDAAVHFAEGAPTDEARDYILSQWEPWELVLTRLREALDELGLLETAEKLDLRTPVHDYFDPLFSTGFRLGHLDSPDSKT
ncbi:site-specific integrase [Nocardia fusca]|uniref:site-specific integrase n=1 Tax=Nocardia fusca TaxID=941183 RepID=UPI0007A76221|nr:site-specific integrase [Nocardia fusca]